MKIVGVNSKKTVGAQAFSAYTAAFIQLIYKAYKKMSLIELKIPNKSKLKTSYNFEDFFEINPTALPLYEDLRKEFRVIIFYQQKDFFLLCHSRENGNLLPEQTMDSRFCGNDNDCVFIAVNKKQ